MTDLGTIENYKRIGVNLVPIPKKALKPKYFSYKSIRNDNTRRKGVQMVNWEKIKNDFTKDKPSSYYHITGSEYFGRWATAKKMGWLDNQNISKLGYEVYLTVLTVMGKDSIWGSPKRTQKSTKHIDM